MLLDTFCILTFLPLLAAVHLRDDFINVVLKDCYSYENNDNALTMGTLEQMKCMTHLILKNDENFQLNPIDLLRIHISMTHLKNGGPLTLDIPPIIEKKTFDLLPKVPVHLSDLIKRRVKRSRRYGYDRGYGRKQYTPSELPNSDLKKIIKEILDSPAPVITTRFKTHWNLTDPRTYNRSSKINRDHPVNLENLKSYLKRHYPDVQEPDYQRIIQKIMDSPAPTIKKRFKTKESMIDPRYGARRNSYRNSGYRRDGENSRYG
ncbi:uncharacterized protein LOC134723731 [Mytilus trossulus]|uniref:uncharacterized protein LOC134723731 n=1 Tax=Mytilus trossulus TaxID=6551 RepID=UPI003005A745